MAFTFFIRSGLARYNVVYGSLGALVALLSWVYMIAAIILFGAHLAASIAGSAGREDAGRRPRGIVSSGTNGTGDPIRAIEGEEE